jgi:hypothetical protein
MSGGEGREGSFFFHVPRWFIAGAPIVRNSVSYGGNISPNCVTWLGEWVGDPLIAAMDHGLRWER